MATVDPTAVTKIADEEYVYDEIGNLVEDKARGTAIEWTVYGKVKRGTKEDGSSVEFEYDGAGNRVAKVFRYADGEEKTTYYSRDASGNVMAVYQGEELAEQPIYGSSRLGMYTGEN
jgi:YD repeat-containing protein